MVPIRRSTPYRRSKPVWIARAVNEVDRTASAIMLGDHDAEAVDPGGATDVDDLGQREDQQQADGQDDREQELLAVAHQHRQLEPGVGQHPASAVGAADGRGVTSIMGGARHR